MDMKTAFLAWAKDRLAWLNQFGYSHDAAIHRSYNGERKALTDAIDWIEAYTQPPATGYNVFRSTASGNFADWTWVAWFVGKPTASLVMETDNALHPDPYTLHYSEPDGSYYVTEYGNGKAVAIIRRYIVQPASDPAPTGAS